MASVMTQPTELPVPISATKLLINNRWVSSESGETFATVNPSTGEEICQVAAADSADVDKAVQAARNAFEQGPWRTMNAFPQGHQSLLPADTAVCGKAIPYQHTSRFGVCGRPSGTGIAVTGKSL